MNTTRNQKLLILAMITILALAAGAALAQGPGRNMKGKARCGDAGMVRGERGERGEMRLARLAERLDLTEEQVEAIRGIREESREENLEIRKQMMRLRNELDGEMLQDEPSRKKVLDLNEKMGELRTQQQANRLKNRLAVREQLTPEQRDHMLVMREGRKGGKGRRGMGPRHEMGSGRFGGMRGMNPDCPNIPDAQNVDD